MMEEVGQASHTGSPEFHKARHVKYWLRCLKTFLPSVYTANDSQRMTLAFFTLSALDLLSSLEEHTTLGERQGYVDWIYKCQHPKGGFKGFTGADGGSESCWDPANLAATFFALAALSVLGDAMTRVDVQSCRSWLQRLQKEDGSFGEALGKDGVIEGGEDIRYCYLAAAVRWILNHRYTSDDDSDIKVDELAAYVERSATYEGGIAKSPFEEAHAGWTYCGLGALVLLDRWPGPTDSSPVMNSRGGLNRHSLLHWLLSRQTSYIQENEDDPDDEMSERARENGKHAFERVNCYPAVSAKQPDEAEGQTTAEMQCAGFNGRCNKVADTCYAFWVGGSLAMLQSLHLQELTSSRQYLLGKTQHLIGGFGKLSGDSPDILHSYLGLAALALMDEPGLQGVDPTLCISLRAKHHLQNSNVAISNPR